jgi:hypothetical protein
MPDISNIDTSDVIGFDAQGGFATSADGQFSLQNDAATNVFTIDVDGSMKMVAEDDLLSLNNGVNPQEFRVYNTDDGAGNAEYLRQYWDSNVAIIEPDASGTGTARDLTLGGTYVNISGQRIVFANGGIIGSNVGFGGSTFGVVGYNDGPRMLMTGGVSSFRNGAIELEDLSADPSDPANGFCRIWQSDGTESGNDGDLMTKITDSAGTTTTGTFPLIESNELAIKDGDSFSVYNIGGPGDTDYERVRIYDNGSAVVMRSEYGGSGSQFAPIVLDTQGSGAAVQLKTGGFSRATFGSVITLSSPIRCADVAIGVTGFEAKSLGLTDQSSDPADPGNGSSVFWQSDGTESGNDGDLMAKITNSLGTTTTGTFPLIESDILSLNNGTNPQEFRIYNTDGAGNAEYIRQYWSGNTFHLITAWEGTGTARKLYIGGDLELGYRTTRKMRFGDYIQCAATVIPDSQITGSLGHPDYGLILRGWKYLTLSSQSSDPLDPRDNGSGGVVIWQSDGTGSGNDGDLMAKITDSTGTTATGTFPLIKSDILSLSNVANPQEFRIYNTDDGAGNAEWMSINWSSDDVVIETNDSGTGSAENIIFKPGGNTALDLRTDGPIIYGTLRGNSSSSVDLGMNIVPFRNIYLHPSSSLTPLNNGDLNIEATNNTTLTFKYKGSDGVVRSGTVALS